MPKLTTGKNVFDSAIDRIADLYATGDEVVVSFSAGKDSGVLVELAVMAAEMAGRLPVNVVMRDEEIMLPGTFEYAERVAARPEINFHWIYACQPIINMFNRVQPYWWVFDPELPPEKWVRRPPSFAYRTPNLAIDDVVSPQRFPHKPGHKIWNLIGLRVDESINRKRGLFSSGGYLTKGEARPGVWNARPIYDWTGDDIWKAIFDNQWDFNSAYTVMHRMGINRKALRIAPPTMLAAGAPILEIAAKAWPDWFSKVCERLPGVRSVARFGRRAVEPIRRVGETWEQCFYRTCVDDAPAWIADRAVKVKDMTITRHAGHSSKPFPEFQACMKCGQVSNWQSLATIMFSGEPFLSRLGAQYSNVIPYIEPEFFRQGAGQWMGKPTF